MADSKAKLALARVVAAEGFMGIKRHRLPASVRADYDTARKAGLLVSAGLETSCAAGDWLNSAEGEIAVAKAHQALAADVAGRTGEGGDGT